MIGNPEGIQEEITNSVIEFKAIKEKSKSKVSKLIDTINLVGLLGFIGGYIVYGWSGVLTVWLVGMFLYLYAMYKECYWEKKLGINIPMDRLENILTIPEVKNALIKNLQKRELDTKMNIDLLKAKEYLINDNINEAIKILLDNKEVFLDLNLEDKSNENKSIEIGKSNSDEKTYKNVKL